MKAFGKDILRTIAKNKKRFASIAIITALGVTMFTGLSAGCEDLRQAADDLFDEQDQYDIQIVSTLGLTQEDVEALSAVSGIERVQGIYYETVLTEVDGKMKEAQVEVIYEDGLGTPTLLEGDLPENNNEIAVTQGFLDDTGAVIGDEITLEPEEDDDDSGDDDEDSSSDDSSSDDDTSQEDTDGLNNYTFTITGTVLDSADIVADSGASSYRSSNSIEYYFYVDESTVDSDIFTAIEITVEGASELSCYSDEYSELVSAVVSRIEQEIKEDREQARYDSVVSEAQDELDEAVEEMNEEFAEAEEEIEEAEEEIEEAEEEIEDGEKEIEDGEEEISRGWDELNEQEAEALSQFADAYSQIEDGYAQIEASAEELEESQQQIADGLAQLEEAWAQLSEQEESTYSQIDSGISQLESALSEAKEGLSQIESAIAQIEDAISMLSDIGVLSEITYVSDSDSDSQEDDASQDTDDNEETETDTDSSYLSSLYSQLESLSAQAESLRASITLIEENIAELSETKAAAQAQFQEAEETLLANEQELTEAAALIETSKQAIEEARAELDSSLSLLEQQEAEALSELEAAKQTLLEAQSELEEGKAELEDGKAELEDGKEELEDAKTELADAKEDAQEEIASAQADIDDIDTATWYVRDRSYLESYSTVQSDADSISSIGTIFPVMFLAVAILISLTTITRMVEEDRSLIGIYKALGFYNRAVYLKYFVYTMTACIVGGLAGCFFGFYALPKFLFMVFSVMYKLTSYPIVINWSKGLLGIVMFIIAIVGSALITCRGVLTQMPAALMRPKAPKAGSKVFLEHITFIWKRLKFLNKVTARNLFRYKKRLLMTIAGITGCTALVLVGLSIRDTVTNLRPSQYSEIYQYDLLAVSLAEDFEEVENYISESDEITDYITLEVTSIKAINPSNDEMETVQIYIVPDGVSLHSYIGLETDDEDEISIPSEGILVTYNMADVMSFASGDTLQLQTLDLMLAEAQVADIVHNYLGNAVYISESYYNELFGDYETNAALAHITDECTDHIAFSDTLSEDLDLISCLTTQKLQEDFSMSFQLINSVVVLITVLAAALAFVVLFTLATTNISEREREIATIKVLGFFDREVHLYINKETMILTGIGIAFGLPVGYLLSMALEAVLHLPAVNYAAVVAPVSYAIAAGLTFVFALAVNLFTNRSLDNVVMVEALKSVE